MYQTSNPARPCRIWVPPAIWKTSNGQLSLKLWGKPGGVGVNVAYLGNRAIQKLVKIY